MEPALPLIQGDEKTWSRPIMRGNGYPSKLTEPLHRTSTQNLYIDQALITNMVKAKEGRITRPDLIALFEVLNMGMRAEKIVCPRSWFHREEGSLTSLGTAIQRYLRFISQLISSLPGQSPSDSFFNGPAVGVVEDGPRHVVLLRRGGSELHADR